jgi:hypothetical protein
MTSIQQIIDEFKSSYESNTGEVSLSEMKKKLTEIYKKHAEPSEKKEKKPKKEKKDEGEDVNEKKYGKTPRKALCMKKIKKDCPDNKEEKKKREPTFYNLFMREKMAELKEDKEMSGKDKMKKIAEMWGEQNKK